MNGLDNHLRQIWEDPAEKPVEPARDESEWYLAFGMIVFSFVVVLVLVSLAFGLKHLIF